MEPALSFRRAQSNDADCLLAWRNDEQTRAYSRDPRQVEREAHGRWLAAALADPAVCLMIVEKDGHPIGTVRYDFGPDETELSWTIDPAWRGRGLGTAMLRGAARRVNVALRAVIHRDNVASQKMATRAGFTQTASAGPWATWRLPASPSPRGAPEPQAPEE